LTLSTLAARDDKPLEGFGLFGVVKEVEVDDEGLTDFYSAYYKYPLYKDAEKAFYGALGSRTMGITTWNPFSWVGSAMNMRSRFKEKNINGNMKGEGLTQGGVIVFDKNGQARYAYQERTGEELPVDEILDAVQAVRQDRNEL